MARLLGAARALLLCLLAVPAVTRADASTEARLREALRSATARAQSAEDEKARLQASEAALRKEVEELRKRPATGGAGDRRAAELQRRLAEQDEAAAKARAALARCEAAQEEAASRARAAEVDRDRTSAEAKALQGRLAAADARNARMYRIGREVLDWIDELGPGAAYEAREPLLGLKRVELENVSQDYRDKLLEQKARP